MKECKTINEIAKILNMHLETLRPLLCRSEFTKYISKKLEGNRIKKAFVFNKDFVRELNDILEIRRKFECAKLLKDYWNNGGKMTENEKLIQENSKLKESLELATKQHEILVKKYHELLKMSKENSDSFEFCLRDLELENEKLKEALYGKI